MGIIIFLSIICVLLLALVHFLGREHLRKFTYLQKFTDASSQTREWTYPGSTGRRGMRTIVLRADQPFTALVGFRLGIPLLHYSGVDYYGYVSSDADHTAAFATYIGRGPATFIFLVNADFPAERISISADDTDQQLPPQETYPPHWYQRLGFYG